MLRSLEALPALLIPVGFPFNFVRVRGFPQLFFVKGFGINWDRLFRLHGILVGIHITIDSYRNPSEVAPPLTKDLRGPDSHAGITTVSPPWEPQGTAGHWSTS